jgi:uncharacterized protein (TIGR02001 family)
MPAPRSSGSPGRAAGAAVRKVRAHEAGIGRQINTVRIVLASAGIAGWLAALPATAQAQLSGSVALTSDYRVRGVSLSDRRPALSVGVSDDLANGVFLGGSAIVQDAPGSHGRLLAYEEYAGYAQRLTNGMTWEVGLDNQRYEGYGAAPVRLSYSEGFFGLSAGRVTTRLYYSQNYNGSDHNIAYLETNAALRPTGGWRVTGHVGVFEPLNAWRGVSMRPRYDARVDVIRKLGPAELSLGWAAASPPVGPERKRSRGAVIVGLAAYF